MRNKLSVNESYPQIEVNEISLDFSGTLSCLTLKKCNPILVRSKSSVKKYLLELCDLLGARRYGDIQFYEDTEEEFKVTQLIDTSYIAGYFKKDNEICIELFSVKYHLSSELIIEFSRQFFNAKSYTTSTIG